MEEDIYGDEDIYTADGPNVRQNRDSQIGSEHLRYQARAEFYYPDRNSQIGSEPLRYQARAESYQPQIAENELEIEDWDANTGRP